MAPSETTATPSSGLAGRGAAWWRPGGSLVAAWWQPDCSLVATGGRLGGTLMGSDGANHGGSLQKTGWKGVSLGRAVHRWGDFSPCRPSATPRTSRHGQAYDPSRVARRCRIRLLPRRPPASANRLGDAVTCWGQRLQRRCGAEGPGFCGLGPRARRQVGGRLPPSACFSPGGAQKRAHPERRVLQGTS